MHVNGEPAVFSGSTYTVNEKNIMRDTPRRQTLRGVTKDLN